MKIIKQKNVDKNNEGLKTEERNSSVISEDIYEIVINNNAFHSGQPKNTSTPMSIKICPLNKKKSKVQDDLMDGLYEIVNVKSDMESNMSGIKIYEHFDMISEEIEREEKQIYENIIFLKSLEIDTCENDDYEIVTVQY